jgi:hypothetical protein
MLAALLLVAQDSPLAGVDPSSRKANDSVAVMGTNLGKANVSAVFLSDNKSDYKASKSNPRMLSNLCRASTANEGGLANRLVRH